MKKITVEFQCSAAEGRCIFVASKNVCIDPFADEGSQVCPELRVVRSEV